MNKGRRRFLLYSMLAVFVMLTVLTVLINAINFAMAADDADMITEMLASGSGRFGGEAKPGDDGRQFSIGDGNAPPDGNDVTRPDFGRIGPMGPDSPETSATIRYFTFRFDRNGNCEPVAMQISAFTEDEARAIAEKLRTETVGWTMTTYRYRVYKSEGSVFVTVIDQGRELLPCFRILLISVIGEIVGLTVSFIFLWSVGKRLFKPLEESDRKQKRFIADAERELKIPLTVIDANVELLERNEGPDDTKASIRRQVKKMSGLIRKLGDLAIFADEDLKNSLCDLSAVLNAATDSLRPAFEERGAVLKAEIEKDVTVNCSPEVLTKAVSEIADNALKFTKTHAEFSLKRDGEHIVLTASNDADIDESGSIDQVFDRFTVLSAGKAKDGAGLGLAFVKDTVKAIGGRLHASAENGTFILKIII